MSRHMVSIVIAMLGVNIQAQQNAPSVSSLRVPTMEVGTVWVVKDSATCTSRTVLTTRNAKSNQERDRQETPSSVVRTELERHVTVAAVEGGASGTVTYKRAVLASPVKDGEQVLSVQGKTFPFALRAGTSIDSIIKAEGDAETTAIAANDRVGSLLAMSGKAVFVIRGSEALIDSQIWSAIAGQYLGSATSMQCEEKGSDKTGFQLECRPATGNGESQTITIRLSVSESSDGLASGVFGVRRTKESRSKAATPDDEVVTVETRDCKVQTAQTLAPAGAAQ